MNLKLNLILSDQNYTFTIFTFNIIIHTFATYTIILTIKIKEVNRETDLL